MGLTPCQHGVPLGCFGLVVAVAVALCVGGAPHQLTAGHSILGTVSERPAGRTPELLVGWLDRGTTGSVWHAAQQRLPA